MGSKTEFANNSLNSPKIGKLNIDTLIISQGLLIHEKTRVKKSHATVPLIGSWRSYFMEKPYVGNLSTLSH